MEYQRLRSDTYQSLAQAVQQRLDGFGHTLNLPTTHVELLELQQGNALLFVRFQSFVIEYKIKDSDIDQKNTPIFGWHASDSIYFQMMRMLQQST